MSERTVRAIINFSSKDRKLIPVGSYIRFSDIFWKFISRAVFFCLRPRDSFCFSFNRISCLVLFYFSASLAHAWGNKTTEPRQEIKMRLWMKNKNPKRPWARQDTRLLFLPRLFDTILVGLGKKSCLILAAKGRSFFSFRGRVMVH